MSADIRGNAAAALAADNDLSPGEHLRAEIERLCLDPVWSVPPARLGLLSSA